MDPIVVVPITLQPKQSVLFGLSAEFSYFIVDIEAFANEDDISIVYCSAFEAWIFYMPSCHNMQQVHIPYIKYRISVSDNCNNRYEVYKYIHYTIPLLDCTG